MGVSCGARGGAKVVHFARAGHHTLWATPPSVLRRQATSMEQPGDQEPAPCSWRNRLPYSSLALVMSPTARILLTGITRKSCDGKPAGLRIAEAPALTHACRGERSRADARAKVCVLTGEGSLCIGSRPSRWW